MATGTTFQTIRRNYYDKIEAITPTYLAMEKFRRPDVRRPLRLWASESAGSQVLRCIELVLDSVGEEPLPHMDPEAYRRNDLAELLIAYPVDLSMYEQDDGDADMDNIEDVINTDSDKIRDVLTSTGNIVTGQDKMLVLGGRRTDRGNDNVWFHVIPIEITYTRIQTLT